MSGITARDIREFNAYLAACTDRQVQGVFDKEVRLIGHESYVELVRAEAAKRGIVLEEPAPLIKDRNRR